MSKNGKQESSARSAAEANRKLLADIGGDAIGETLVDAYDTIVTARQQRDQSGLQYYYTLGRELKSISEAVAACESESNAAGRAAGKGRNALYKLVDEEKSTIKQALAFVAAYPTEVELHQLMSLRRADTNSPLSWAMVRIITSPAMRDHRDDLLKLAVQAGSTEATLQAEMSRILGADPTTAAERKGGRKIKLPKSLRHGLARWTKINKTYTTYAKAVFTPKSLAEILKGTPPDQLDAATVKELRAYVAQVQQTKALVDSQCEVLAQFLPEVEQKAAEAKAAVKESKAKADEPAAEAKPAKSKKDKAAKKSKKLKVVADDAVADGEAGEAETQPKAVVVAVDAASDRPKKKKGKKKKDAAQRRANLRKQLNKPVPV